MIDQTRLPVELVEIDCHDVEAVWEAIKMLRVRGAPAIGIAAAYGVCLGLQTAAGQDEAAFFQRLEQVAAYLATSRPTAVNLFWALDRMKAAGGKLRGRPVRREIAACLLQEARAIHEEDRAMCRAIGEHGAKLLGRRPGRAHALQRRRAGHGRIRHGAGRVLHGRRAGQAIERLCRRDPAAPARRAADRLGTAAAPAST